MIKCVCGCDPEVCACAFQQFHVPPPDSEQDRIEMEDEDWEDFTDPDFEMPTDD